MAYQFLEQLFHSDTTICSNLEKSHNSLYWHIIRTIIHIDYSIIRIPHWDSILDNVQKGLKCLPSSELKSKYDKHDDASSTDDNIISKQKCDDDTSTDDGFQLMNRRSNKMRTRLKQRKQKVKHSIEYCPGCEYCIDGCICGCFVICCKDTSKMLIVHERNNNKWGVPGGKPNKNIDKIPLDIAEREFLEEFGIIPTITEQSYEYPELSEEIKKEIDQVSDILERAAKMEYKVPIQYKESNHYMIYYSYILNQNDYNCLLNLFKPNIEVDMIHSVDLQLIISCSQRYLKKENQRTFYIKQEIEQIDTKQKIKKINTKVEFRTRFNVLCTTDLLKYCISKCNFKSKYHT